MGYSAKRAGIIVGGIVGGFVVFAVLQMILPFPFGLYVGITLLAIIVATCIIISIVVVKPPKLRTTEKSAMAILQDRYAKGEITKDEFVKMKKDLE